MNFEINDWVVSTGKGQSVAFRVCGFAKMQGNVVPIREEVDIDLWLVDKWGGKHNPKFFKKYQGAISPLEAAEAAKDEFNERFPQAGK